MWLDPNSEIPNGCKPNASLILKHNHQKLAIPFFFRWRSSLHRKREFDLKLEETNENGLKIKIQGALGAHHDQPRLLGR